jgi:hypothetical protein
LAAVIGLVVAMAVETIAATALPSAPPQMPANDATRVSEFYRLTSQIQDRLWPDWDRVPAPLLLVTPQVQFLTHWPQPAPKDFIIVAPDLYAAPRTFPTNFSAALPVFGPPAVMVVGEPANTYSKTSTPWLIAVIHEHFHQLQDAQPGYFQAVDGLGLRGGDTTGMWMLTYKFPYDDPRVAQDFARLRDLLLQTVAASDDSSFATLAGQYVKARGQFFGTLSPDDHKYMSFQLWQEGIARYTQVKAAEAAADYQPTAQFIALPDYEPFGPYASVARSQTIAELKQIDLVKAQRNAFYSFGAVEGFLLDRLNPGWKSLYFKRMLSTDSYFAR